VSYTDAGLASATTYTYQVRAVNAAGASAWSNQVTATTPAVPAAPAGLTVSTVPGAQLNLSWIDTSADETAFAVWRKATGSDWARIAVLPPGTTGYCDCSVAPNTTYGYEVRAVNSAGVSAWSNEVSATTPDVPSTPVGLGVGTPTYAKLDLSWSDG